MGAGGAEEFANPDAVYAEGQEEYDIEEGEGDGMMYEGDLPHPEHMEKPFACNMCNFRAARLGNLTVHMRTHTGEKPFACHLCNYSASHSSNLKSHVRNIHHRQFKEGNKPH